MPWSRSASTLMIDPESLAGVTTPLSVVTETLNVLSTATIKDLTVIETDLPALLNTFKVSVTTDSGVVTPASDSGSIIKIDADLLQGITYAPGAHPPQTDKITMTVTDAFGDSDTVHFIFDQAGAPAATGSPTTLHGTPGKDVIFGTSHGDVLTGGGGQDQFVFQPTSGPNPVQHTITDFDVSQDKIDLREFTGIDTANVSQWLAHHAVQQGQDTLLTLDHNDTVRLKNVLPSSLHASDFIVSLHGIS